MRKLSEELAPRGHGGEGQVPVMAPKRVKIDSIFFLVNFMFLELLCDVFHNERPELLIDVAFIIS